MFGGYFEKVVQIIELNMFGGHFAPLTIGWSCLCSVQLGTGCSVRTALNVDTPISLVATDDRQHGDKQ
jgi:hypothetical protein